MLSRSANSREEPPGTEPETIVVGVLLRPHGIHGELKVEVHSDNPERFARGSELLLGSPGRPRRVVRVASFRPARGGGLIELEGCATREAAEELRGMRLEVERARIPTAPPGHYYYYELVGCRCFDAERGELGEVVDLLEDGGGHLLRIRDGDRELLVPFVDAFLEAVDVAASRIDVRLPPGLVEICASES